MSAATIGAACVAHPRHTQLCTMLLSHLAERWSAQESHTSSRGEWAHGGKATRRDPRPGGQQKRHPDAGSGRSGTPSPASYSLSVQRLAGDGPPLSMPPRSPLSAMSYARTQRTGSATPSASATRRAGAPSRATICTLCSTGAMSTSVTLHFATTSAHILTPCAPAATLSVASRWHMEATGKGIRRRKAFSSAPSRLSPSHGCNHLWRQARAPSTIDKKGEMLSYGKPFRCLDSWVHLTSSHQRSTLSVPVRQHSAHRIHQHPYGHLPVEGSSPRWNCINHYINLGGFR
jgi:hypothetical protein